MKIKSFSMEQTETTFVLTALTENGELFIKTFDLMHDKWGDWINISEDLPTGE